MILIYALTKINNNSSYLRNKQIKAQKVFVLDKENIPIGEMETIKAINLALNQQLDLVQISLNEQRTICKIVDYGKFLYQENKKKSHISNNKTKEVQISHNISSGDLETKISLIKKLLLEKDNVLLFIKLKRFELENNYSIEASKTLMQKIVKNIEDEKLGKLMNEIKLNGVKISCILSHK